MNAKIKQHINSRFDTLNMNKIETRRFQGLVGVAVMLLFIVGSFAVNQTVQALNLAAGSYGYYSGAYGYAATTSSDDLPATSGNFACTATSSTRVVCSWAAITLTASGTSLDNFQRYVVNYSTTDTTPDSDDSTWTNTNDSTLGTQGTATTTITGLTADTTYYLALYTRDVNGNLSATSGVQTAATQAAAATGNVGGGTAAGGGGGTTTTPTTTTPTTTTTPSTTTTTGTGTTTTTQAPGAPLGTTTQAPAAAEASGIVVPTESLRAGGFAYGAARVANYQVEAKSAQVVKVNIDKALGAKVFNALFVKNIAKGKLWWATYVNAYVYGGYPIKAIQQSIKYGGKTVHPIIPWSAWKNAPDYKNYINR